MARIALTAKVSKRTDLTSFFQVFPATVYLMIFFAIPGVILLLYSFWQKAGFTIAQIFTLENYRTVLTNELYLRVTANSLVIGVLTAFFTTLIAYPLAYGITFKIKKYQGLMLLLIFVSVVGSYLSRIYAWKSILGERGLINSLLLSTHLIQEPLSFLVYNRAAVIITLTNLFIPFAFLPIYSALQNINSDLIEAARDLGAGPGRVFYKITLPLSISGVVSGFLYTLIFASSDFVVSALVGGKTGLMTSKVIADQFGLAFNWPLGSALAFSFLISLVGLFLLIYMLLKILKIRGVES